MISTNPCCYGKACQHKNSYTNKSSCRIRRLFYKQGKFSDPILSQKLQPCPFSNHTGRSLLDETVSLGGQSFITDHLAGGKRIQMISFRRFNYRRRWARKDALGRRYGNKVENPSLLQHLQEIHPDGYRGNCLQVVASMQIRISIEHK